MARVVIFDETGLNPVPAGIFVNIFRPPSPPAVLTWTRASTLSPLPQYDGVTHLGGLFDVPTLNLVPGQLYGIMFTGVQAPGQCSAHFIAAPVGALSIALASAYRSPSLSQLGYTQEETDFWPRGWFSSAASSPGGNAYGLAYGLAGVLGSPIINGIVDANSADQDLTTPILNNGVPNIGHWSLDESTQQTLEEMRLETSQGADIDSWVLDVLDSVFVRCTDETDYAWIQQVIQILTIFRNPGLVTCAGIQAILRMLYPCFLNIYNQTLALDTQGGLDTWGGFDIVPGQGHGLPKQWMGLDTQGAFDTLGFMDEGFNVSGTSGTSGPVYYTPEIWVFDGETNPLWASYLGGVPPPTFVIYFQYAGIPDSAMARITYFIGVLDQLVRAIKAEGTTYIYASNSP